MNTLIVIESLTIVNLLNKVQFPFVKVFPPQMLSSSSEGAIVQAVPIAFAPVFTFTMHAYFQLLNSSCFIVYFFESSFYRGSTFSGHPFLFVDDRDKGDRCHCGG